ncbi:fasciclin domain-containing protein [Sulfitobacter aestuariivivens]|uniref:Fasciclin domain-containing protein n=1 Tax=Sulfitobacter aestuariivivens TaxID=2766981 RepID=A0A927D3E9_9RHOB|nr:fasciclin domain-containing protein [Sulfitobacter aestuariivivens]MBD3662547.1 fasciclin domain-containing protein [Sulfitobacter aestuariivivens]
MNRRFVLKSTAAVGLLGLAGCATANGGSIVDVAAGNDAFTTLVAAVTAAGLVDTLAGPGPFTVFAPTNDAFAALPAGTVDSLLLPENKDQLISILTYHVVPGVYPASALIGQTGSLNTAQGGRLNVDGTDGVKVNGATVIIPDVAASNGVIHAIDTVLLP